MQIGICDCMVIYYCPLIFIYIYKFSISGRKKAASDSAQTLSNVENVINTSDAKNDDSEATTVVIKEGSVKNNGWSIMDYLMIIIFYVIINYALSIRSKNISLAKM